MESYDRARIALAALLVLSLPAVAGAVPIGSPASSAPEVLRPQSGSDAAPAPVHPEAEEAIGRLRSPWCPGFMLEVCPSPNAAAFRDSLRMMAHEGIESDSLVEWALAQHGEEWRALPEAEGTGLLAWLIPPIVLILGVGVVVLVLRHLRKGPGGPGSEEGAAEISEEEEHRLAEALREFEGEGR